jgi:hypothetical protein
MVDLSRDAPFCLEALYQALNADDAEEYSAATEAARIAVAQIIEKGRQIRMDANIGTNMNGLVGSKCVSV